MEWQQTPYTLPLIITGLITFASAFLAYRHRQIPGAIDLLRMLLGITLWSLFYALELQAAYLQDKLLFAKVEYLGIVYVPIGYLLFVLRYFGDIQKLKYPRRTIATLFAIPLITLLLVWTNESHHLIWSRTTLDFYQGAGYLAVEYGLWFWINLSFAYIVLVGSTYLLLRKIFKAQSLYRSQIALLMAGSLFPWLGNALYITGNNPFPNLDLTPFAFAATALFFAWALFRFNFLDIVPVARGVVIEKLEEGVIVVDGLLRVIDINETAVTLLQKDKKSSIGQPLTFDHPQWILLQDILRQSEPTKIELTFGDEYFEVSAIPLENTAGQTKGRLITLHNVTHRKESELLLQKAKEAAEAAVQAKTNFLTNMSHEIRTPLNAVVGMSEMLRQTNLNLNQKEMIEVVARSSHELMLLINNILDFAKLEEDDVTLNEQSFDLVDCIEAALDKVQKPAKEKQLQLSCNIADQTPTQLLGDPVRLRQILVNLLENGIKFAEEGGVDVSVSHVKQKGNVLLQFIVKDSGIGISSEQMEQLFSPFQQGDGSLTRTHGGTGLGLVICKRLVKLMGGNIYLHSTIGEGTAVHFSAQFGIATEAHPPAITLRNQKDTLANKRLLLITTNAASRRHISKEARMAGLEMYAAGSSQEAKYWINKSQPFDAVLLEMALWQEEPNIPAQLLHNKSKMPLPILLLTPEDAKMASAKINDDLFAGFLPYPVVSSQMYDMLLNVLSINQLASPAREIGELMATQHPLRILVVEDNKLNQHILIRMLKNLGYKADCVANGELGVKAVAQTEYDIILMDIQMPVMDGIEATKEIIANTVEEKRPYIIAITAHALEGDREYYLSQGMNEYVSKPVKPNQLVEALYLGIGYKNSALQATKMIDAATPAIPPPSAKPASPTLNTAKKPPIDYDKLAHLVGNDTETFLEMMAPIFLEDTTNILQNMEQAILTSNGKGVQQAAHTLKGSSASMGMTQLFVFSQDIETMGREDNLTQASQIFLEIQAEYSRIEATLAQFMETVV
ncbi:MAG: response regulator [Chloroflexi bacterium]|nr:response regulator [Chloroflexota bacterium]